ncbi:MAG TPA: hypothetical protein VF865_21645 [Acidobacteriaceae bacterium]
MSAAAAVLPFVWAFAKTPEQRPLTDPIPYPARPLEPQVAFYRKYTEALLKRYTRLFMQSGKVPSPMGREMFHARVSSYRMVGFDDVVIFLHDVERSLEKLEPDQQHLIRRISLQEFTIGETAAMLRLPPRTVIRRYGSAIDRLTRVLIDAKILVLQNCCQ